MKKILLIILIIMMTASVCYAAGTNDTENYIDYANDKVEISRKKTELSAGDFWVRDQKNLITNFYSMYCPEVVYMAERDNGTDYPYLMYFFGWAYNQENDPAAGYPGYPGGDSIFLARAKAVEGPWEVYMGDNKWDKNQSPRLWVPVIVCSDTWDSNWHVGDPSIVYKDGTLYMAYSGMGCDVDGIPSHKSGDKDGNTGCIKVATSTDGINWDIKKDPILIWEGEKGFNDKASAYNTYYGGYQRPSLMYEDGKWKCWFDYAGGSHGQRVGYAECTGDFADKNAWERINVLTKAEDWDAFGNKTIMGVDFEVIKIGSTYYAYGDPYLDWYGISSKDLPKLSSSVDPSGWSRRQITEYQSKDGQAWKVTGYFLPDTGYDADQIPQPFIDHKNNRICIFYATQRGTKQSKSSYDWRWDNIRFMYKSLNDFQSNTTDSDRTPLPAPTPSPTATKKPTMTAVTQTTQPQESAGINENPKTAFPWIIIAVEAAAVAAIAVVIVLVLKKKKKK